MNLTKKINRKKGSPEINNSSTSSSNLFARVARPPKSLTTETECAIKQRRKLSSNADQVRERPLILSLSQQNFDSFFNCSFCCHYRYRCCFGAVRREPGYVVCLFVCLFVLNGLLYNSQEVFRGDITSLLILQITNFRTMNHQSTFHNFFT